MKKEIVSKKKGRVYIMKTKLNIYALISLALLVMLTSNVSACWVKLSPVYDSGNAYISKSYSSYAGADIYNYAGPEHLWVDSFTVVEPYFDPTYDDLYANADLSGAFCEQEYEWDYRWGPTPQPHTFNLTWHEFFHWHIKGDADNYGSGLGESISEIHFLTQYYSFPYSDVLEYHVHFFALSDKTEDLWWDNELNLSWEPLLYPYPPLEWDDEAFWLDNTYMDIPDFSTHRACSEDIYSSYYDHVVAGVCMNGHSSSEGYDDSYFALAGYTMEVHDFDLSY